MPSSRSSDARALATISPRGVAVSHRHPRLSTYARVMSELMNQNQYHGGLFAAGYARFGDEMEAALRSLPTRRPKAVEFVSALPDPWMMTGHLTEELSDEFFELWQKFRVPERENALGLLNLPLPSRVPELLKWMGKHRLSTYPSFFDGDAEGDDSRVRSWANTIGFSISSIEGFARDRDRFSVTEADIYEMMDSNTVLPISLGQHGSLQETMARLQGKFTLERRALSRVDFRYPVLPPERAEEFPQAARFFGFASTGDVPVSAPVDVEKFEAVLQESEGLSLNALRERVAYNLEDVSDIYGRQLPGPVGRVWGEMLELSSWPERAFAAAFCLSGSAEDVELVLSWMPRHVRQSEARVSNWLAWVMLPEAADVSWGEAHLLPESDLPTVCRLIRAGVTWQQLRDALTLDRLSMDEVVEVFVNGTPLEYVVAMRSSL